MRFLSTIFIVISPVLLAAERLPDFPAAVEKAKSGGQDIAVLFHGSDWCTPGKKLAALWTTEAFEKSAGKDLLLVDIDRKESPSSADEALAKRNEACPVKPRSLPAIALFDKDGRLVAVREGTPELDSLGRPEQAIQRAIDVRKKRDDLWQKAEGMRGPQKAAQLAAGLDLLGIGAGPKNAYQPVIEEIKKADPEDRSGALARYSFPGRKLLDLAVDQGKAGKFTQADEEIGGWLKKPQLTKAQRQEALAARFALYQRWPEKKSGLAGVLKEIEKLDPKSELGTAATTYLAMLSKEK
ncbi:thioredoxin family protein [Luteolibacter arcticus]|uniref:Thioredoxin family protein n=1 Tax=Luteolibacter arcticus TaxID=1581411 RepID=A0ABT3GIK5_9BACT|nr:thioredoxin family protein [Luteolibacter arcticus]MCW1923363.1 thioredoxin family protein [Luteolibacter arcticus]